MQLDDYPALYGSASRSSAAAQSQYFLFIVAEYGLLILASVLSLGFETIPEAPMFYFFAVAAATVVLLIMATKKPEREWYGCRALSESIKTSTWRYMMRAEPFHDGIQIAAANAEFRGVLEALLKMNRHFQDAIARFPPTGEQITSEMRLNREKSLNQRQALYAEKRIGEQLRWYTQKAKSNNNSYRWSIAACVVILGLTIVFAFVRVRSFSHYWPTEPLLLLATSIIGWIQIKKYSELASAYSLTAHEIGIIRSRMKDVHSEAAFSDFVNEAERAFSREHTQWIARQN